MSANIDWREFIPDADLGSVSLFSRLWQIGTLNMRTDQVMIRLDQVMIRLRLVVAGEFSQAELTW